MRYVRRLTRRVWVPESVLEDLIAHAEARLPLETGGILVGYWSQDAGPVVTKVVGPGPRAQHVRDRFSPDYEFHREQAVRWWLETGGTEFYLGDWHSHPMTGPYLSRKDRRALREIAASKGSGEHPALMAVLGRRGSWQLAIWLQEGGRLRVGLSRPQACRIVICH